MTEINKDTSADVELQENQNHENTGDSIELQESEENVQDSGEIVNSNTGTGGENITDLVFGDLLKGVNEVGFLYMIAVVLAIIAIVITITPKYQGSNLTVWLMAAVVILSGWLNKKGR